MRLTATERLAAARTALMRAESRTGLADRTSRDIRRIAARTPASSSPRPVRLRTETGSHKARRRVQRVRRKGMPQNPTRRPLAARFPATGQ